MTDQKEPTDIFLWANRIDAVKEQLSIELFFVNTLYTPYSVRFSADLEASIKALFLYDVVSAVTMGAGTGMSVRDYELSEAEDNVVLRTEVEKVERAQNLLNLIVHKRSDIVEFSEEEHEFKKIKGIVARFSYTENGTKKAFYVAKAVAQSSTLEQSVAWELSGGQASRFKAEVGFKIPAGNQVLIVDDDIFIFNQAKFERLFEYDYKKQLLAEEKVKEIESAYKLSFPEGVSLESLVKERKQVVKKLQKLEVGAVSQGQALDYADTMQLELMTDDAGAIIIMEPSDLDMFVNLINEDYITSEVTGKRYVVTSKKPLDEPSGAEPPRG